MKKIDFEKASFKDFENIEGMDPYGWARLWEAYVADRSKHWQFNYRQENLSGCGPEIELNLPSNPHRNFVSLVSNDYLGFTQHPKVKATAIAAIEKYGSSAGASPAIGGHYLFHQEIENKMLFVGLMQENFKVFSASEEMQKIIHWQISEASALMRSISDEREVEGEKLLKMATPYFKER